MLFYPLKNPSRLHARQFLKLLLNIGAGIPFGHRLIDPTAKFVRDGRIVPIETVLEKDVAANDQPVGKPGIQEDTRLAVVTIYEYQVERFL